MTRLHTLIASLAFAAVGGAYGQNAPETETVSMPSIRRPARPAPAPERFVAEPVAPGSPWWETDIVLLAFVDQDALRLEDEQERSDPLRVGIVRDLDVPVDTAGRGDWMQEADGTWVWRCRILEPGAKSVRLYLDRFEPAPGSVLLVGDLAQKRVTSVKARGKGVWTASAPGELMLLEYRTDQLPAEPPLSITRIVHNYRQTSQSASAGAGCAVSMSCHADVNCASPPVNPAVRDSVGQMTFVSGGNTFVCTGAKLNSSTMAVGGEWFLTAAHCIDTDAEAESLEIAWNYQTNSCFGAVLPGSTACGASLVTTLAQTDMTLLFTWEEGGGLAGWSRNPPDPAGLFTGIHHPAGCYKRVSRGQLDSTPICDDTDNYHYGTWIQGTTEGGSSGSPLFNVEGKVIGQLQGICCNSGGGPGCSLVDCSNQVQTSNFQYGRFDVSFPYVEPYLEAEGTGFTWVDFRDCGVFCPEDGDAEDPHSTLVEGIIEAGTGHVLMIKAGSSSSGDDTFPLTISKSLTLLPAGGAVTIGN